jgi:UDP-glucose 4-epimerase
MPKCLVLGANGFIGSHLVDKLAADGYSVRAFGHFHPSEAKFSSSANVEVFQGDYLNKFDLQAALKDVDIVFHFISTTTPATAEDNPIIDIDTNIRASVELFQQCVKAHVKRVIYASSGGTIYNSESEMYDETDPTLPVSPYAIGKLTVENYLRYFHVKHGLQYTTFRMANPYGERQPFWRKQGVIPIFLEKACNNESLPVLGDGSMVRDYIYIKDLVEMIVATLHKKPKHHIYNLGSGRGYSVNEVVEAIRKVTKKDIKLDTLPVPSTYARKSVLNINRFMSEFGVEPKTPLEEGVRITYKYIRQELKKRRK